MNRIPEHEFMAPGSVDELSNTPTHIVTRRPEITGTTA